MKEVAAECVVTPPAFSPQQGGCGEHSTDFVVKRAESAESISSHGRSYKPKLRTAVTNRASEWSAYGLESSKSPLLFGRAQKAPGQGPNIRH